MATSKDESSFYTNSLTSIGYMEKRNAFEIEFDEDAEVNITDIDFSMLFTQEEIDEKQQYLKVYNERLDERERRKKFIIDHNLTDLKHISQENSKYDPVELEIVHSVNPVASYVPKSRFDRLKSGLIEEYNLMKMIEELKIIEKSGCETVESTELYAKRVKGG